MSQAVFDLIRGKKPVKGNAKQRKKIRWTNRKRAPIRNYFNPES